MPCGPACVAAVVPRAARVTPIALLSPRGGNRLVGRPIILGDEFRSTDFGRQNGRGLYDARLRRAESRTLSGSAEEAVP